MKDKLEVLTDEKQIHIWLLLLMLVVTGNH